MSDTVPFTEKDVKEYLDKVITHWRMCDAPPGMASHYVDAFQSVRMSLFGELLPQEEITPGEPCDQEAPA